MRFWCYWKALEEAICLVDVIGLNCVIWRAREDKASLSQSVAGAWRAQVHRVDYAWRVFLFVYSSLFSSGSIYRLEGSEEVFRQVLRFPL